MFGLSTEALMKAALEDENVKSVLNQARDVMNGIIVAVKHFNERFDKLEAKVDANTVRCDRIIFILENPSNVAPAGPDGLMEMLANSGQEMKIQTVEPISTEVNPDGSVSNKIQ